MPLGRSGSRVLRVELILLILNGLLAGALALGYYVVKSTLHTDETDRRLSDVAQSVAIFTDGYHAAPPPSRAAYDALVRKLDTIARSVGVQYIYTLKPCAAGLCFTLDSAPPDEFLSGNYNLLGAAYPHASPQISAADKTLTIRYDTFRDAWGLHRSVFVPRIIPGGKGHYIIGVDYAYALITADKRRIAVEALVLGLGLFTFLSLVSHLLSRPVSKTLALMAHAAARITHANDSPESTKKMNFLLGEIGDIFGAFTTMQNDIKKYNDRLAGINAELEATVERKTAELHSLYRHDPLTGLPNRVQLHDDIEQLPHATLTIINLNDFREINSLYGTQAGDHLLQSFAQWLQSHLPQGTIYRLAGDEFAFLSEQTDPAVVTTAVGKLLEQLEREEFTDRDDRFDLRATAGISVADPSISRADMALRHARRNKTRLAVYTPQLGMENEYITNIAVIATIKKALAEERIFPLFQPIAAAATGEVSHYEALMRIREADGRILTPDSFLAIAKKTSLYPAMTRMIVRQVCEIFSKRSESVSVNLSAEDLHNSQTVDFIFDTIETFRMNGRIIFELLETEGIDDTADVRDFINRARAHGARIAIDDFGSGYSNFAYVLRLPIDSIKIDGSLIRPLGTTGESQILVRTIVDFCHRLGIKTVAEYVSTPFILDKVTTLGIDYAQGYAISRPIPSDQLPSAGG